MDKIVPSKRLWKTLPWKGGHYDNAEKPQMARSNHLDDPGMVCSTKNAEMSGTRPREYQNG
jgi:hypothetical protein